MQRKLIAMAIVLTMAAPAFAQRGQGRGSGHGTQLRHRIHQPGTGQQTGSAVQKRDRKRDGTGLNCPNGPCAQTQTQTQAQTETQTQAQSETQSQVQARTQTQTKTQQNKPDPKN